MLRSNGRFHLFFLQQHRVGLDLRQAGLGHAVSDDLASWTPLVDIDLSGNPGEWNQEGTPLTGCVVEHDGRFVMLAGSLTPDTGESVYGAFFSDDLNTWEPHSANPVLRAPAAFGHDLANTRDGGAFNAWRDPFIVRRPDGTYDAYLCARSGSWTEAGTGAVIAHASSRDLVDWEHHEPILETDRVKYTEVPGVFQLDGREYAHFLDHGWGGLRIHTPSREDSSGTYYMVASSTEGPYEWPHDALLIGRAHDRMGAWAARILDHEDGPLLYHHIMSERPALGTFKRVKSNPDGSLYLQYLPALESLETGEVVEGAAQWSPRPHDVGVWQQSTSGLTARSTAVGATSLLAPDLGDVHLQCVIRVERGARAGVVVRSAVQATGDAERRVGVAITLDFELQRARVEVLDYTPAEGWAVPLMDLLLGQVGREIDTVNLSLELGRPYHLRCLARAEFIEVYLDDRWLSTTAMASHAPRGDVELYVERGEASFREIRIAELSALD